MSRHLLPSLALLAGCSKGPQADLQHVAAARSLAAEWALVNDQADKNKLTAVYAAAMRKALRKQVQTALGSLSQPDAPYADEMRRLAAEPAGASPQALRAHSERLKQIEDGLESA
jgi:hypothetical protein